MRGLIQQTKLEPQTVFSRVLVGVDSSEESREAARQAAALAEGQLTLLAAYDITATLVDGTPIGAPVYYVGAPVSYIEDLQRETAKDALSRVLEDVAAAAPTGKIVRGGIWDALIREAEREKITLIAVGSHGVGRMSGILMGSVATNVIHKAPCSVLVARKNSDAFPRKIVVGIDGSPESRAAYAAASRLAERFETELVAVVALGGEPVDRNLVDLVVGHHREELPDEPVQALVAAAAEADLLVVGSRGLHGLKALGSVSERVAHEARSSVLIVREPTWQRVSEELAG
jgi:nucleotide-binding universal stress UspA family protein